MVTNINRLSMGITGGPAENAYGRSAGNGGGSVVTGTEVVESENYV